VRERGREGRARVAQGGRAAAVVALKLAVDGPVVGAVEAGGDVLVEADGAVAGALRLHEGDRHGVAHGEHALLAHEGAHAVVREAAVVGEEAGVVVGGAADDAVGLVVDEGHRRGRATYAVGGEATVGRGARPEGRLVVRGVEHAQRGAGHVLPRGAEGGGVGAGRAGEALTGIGGAVAAVHEQVALAVAHRPVGHGDAGGVPAHVGGDAGGARLGARVVREDGVELRHAAEEPLGQQVEAGLVVAADVGRRHA
jgi:hypothetical protein